jgi:uncharacterized membrane protein YadS
LIIKLTRVLMLAPMVTGAAFVERHRRRRAGTNADEGDAKLPPLIPLFVAGFMAAIVLRTVGILPPAALQVAGVAQDLLLAAALYGLGASVQVRSLLKTGGRAVAAAMLSWALIAVVAYVGVQLI